MALNPATPAPMTRTLQGGIFQTEIQPVVSDRTVFQYAYFTEGIKSVNFNQ